MGNKILELRKQNHMSQEQLAEKIGVARQTIIWVFVFLFFT